MQELFLSTKNPTFWLGLLFFEARSARKPSPSGLPIMTSEILDPFGLLISFAGSENPCFFSLFITQSALSFNKVQLREHP